MGIQIKQTNSHWDVLTPARPEMLMRVIIMK